MPLIIWYTVTDHQVLTSVIWRAWLKLLFIRKGRGWRRRERVRETEVGLSLFVKSHKIDKKFICRLHKLLHLHTTSYEVGCQWTNFIDEVTEILWQSQCSVSIKPISISSWMYTPRVKSHFLLCLAIKNIWLRCDQWTAGRCKRVSPPICLLNVDAQDDVMSHMLKMEMHWSIEFSKWLCGTDRALQTLIGMLQKQLTYFDVLNH